MKTKPNRAPLFLLATALASSGALADSVDPQSAAPTPPAAEAPASRANAAAQSVSAASMHVLRERMEEIRRTGDPARRMQLLEAQMNQLDRLIQDLDGSCPIMELPPGVMGRNGNGMSGRAGAMAMPGGDPMLAKRLDMMEKRLDMMQLMLQRQNGPTDAARASSAKPD